MAAKAKNETSLPVVGLVDEPWVHLPNGRELADWTEQDLIAFNQRHRQMAKHAFYLSAFDLQKSNCIAGDYFEFGCHRARTFRMALTEARRRFMDDMHFLAFDSFAGLPECEEDVDVAAYFPGALCTSEEEFLCLVAEHGIYLDKVSIYKGFYNITLTPKLQSELLAQGRKATIVCVDCDLFSSAMDVFNFIGPFLQPGTILYLDDMFAGYQGSPLRGVNGAFLEFQKHAALKFITYMQVGTFGRAFIAYENNPRG